MFISLYKLKRKARVEYFQFDGMNLILKFDVLENILCYDLFELLDVCCQALDVCCQAW